MKRLIYRPLAVAVVVGTIGLNAHAEPPAGQLDFGKFTAPGKGGEFVEVQIGTNLISLAARLVEKEQPEAARLLRSVQFVRVNVVGLTDGNRDEMQKHIQKIRADLDAKGWEHNVNAQQKDGEDVGVYTKTRGAEALQGLAVTVISHDEAVLVNIVGDIRPEQVADLGDSLNLKPLKKIGGVMKK